MLISVIVPVYNVEKYLKKCLDSLIHQTWKELEIILVDDGSTDSSGMICDAYAEKDTRIRVVHQSNGGLSDARNTGLALCRGEYLGFVDSDDWIALDMYEVLACFAQKERLDVAMCGVTDVWPDRIEGTPRFAPVVLTDTDEIISEILVNRRGGTAVPVWSRIYRTRLFKDLIFEKGRYYEDGYYLLKWIERTERFGRLSDRKYFYMHREGSITDIKRHGKRVDDFRFAYEQNLACIKACYPESIPAGEYRLYMTYHAILLMLAGRDDAYCQELAGLIRKNIFRIWRNACVGWKAKVSYSLIALNVHWYFCMRRRYRGWTGKTAE